MRTAATLVFVSTLLVACGEEAHYRPGTIPSTLSFEIVRVSDGSAPGLVREDTASLQVGQPAPDHFDGRTGVWRIRTIFGDLIDDPGARFEFEVETGRSQHERENGQVETKVSTFKECKEDPWRLQFGREYALIVFQDGTATAGAVDVDNPSDVHGAVPTAVVRLVLDGSRGAAHRQLGVLRLPVRLDGETVRTLTEDDFQSARARLGPQDRTWRRAWSLRELSRWQVGHLVGVRGPDGSFTPIAGPDLADATRVPVLRLSQGRFAFLWEGEQGEALGPVLDGDVRALEYDRAR